MKKYLPYLPTVILLYFIGLLSFHTESIGAAIGLIVSALLFSYHHYMENIKNPALLERLAKTEAKLETDYRVEIDKLREEAQKISISLAKMPLTQKVEQSKTKIQF